MIKTATVLWLMTVGFFVFAAFSVVEVGRAYGAPSVWIRDVTPSTGTQGFGPHIYAGSSHVIGGTGFSAGEGDVYLTTCPFWAEGLTLTTQTVTDWTTTAITFTGVVTGNSHGDFVFVCVENDDLTTSTICAPGYIQTSTPTITGLSGTFNHGGEITVTGTDFGTRDDHHDDADKLVFAYADWSAGSVTAQTYRNLTEDGDDTGDFDVSSDTARHNFGNSWFLRVTDNDILDWLQWYAGGVEPSEFHFMGWYRPNITFKASAGVKFHRQMGTGDTGEDFYWGQSLSSGFGYAEDGGSAPYDSCQDSFFVPAVDDNAWHFIETYVRHATCDGCDDGESWIRIDGQLVFDYWKNFNVWNPHPCYSQPEMDGEYNNNNEHGGIFQIMPSWNDEWDTGSTMDMDEEYYDFSRASVLVSTSSTWQATGGAEIQLPTSWSDTSITFTYNAGAIGEAPEAAYLYVFDQYGFVNGTGYLLEAGGEGEEAGTGDVTFRGIALQGVAIE